MRHLPTIKQLKYLVALDEHRHFGKAAAACFVTQSAFSVAIKELETLLGVRLVDRTNRSVTIASIGREVVTQARLCLFDIEGILDLVDTAREPLTGVLKIGVIPTIAPFLIPEFIARAHKAYPKLKVYLKEDQTERIHHLLLTGELDLLVLAFPYELQNVETLSLFKDNFLLAYHEGTEILDPENYSVNRLPEESVLLLEDGHCLRDHALVACKIKHSGKLARFSASSLPTLLQMVDSDLGVTFLPEMACDSNLLKNTQLKTQALPVTASREIGLAWRKSSTRVTEFKLLGDLLRP